MGRKERPLTTPNNKKMTLKSVIVRHNDQGYSLETAELSELHVGVADDSSLVVLRPSTCAVTDLDVRLLDAQYEVLATAKRRGKPAQFSTFGTFVCGVVHECGDEARRAGYAAGQRVACMVPMGGTSGAASLTAVPHWLCVQVDASAEDARGGTVLPAGSALSDEIVASLLLPSLRCYTALHNRFHVKAGDHVVMLNACTWTGCMVALEAARCGVRCTAVVRSEAQRATLSDTLGDEALQCTIDMVLSGDSKVAERGGDGRGGTDTTALPLIHIVKCEQRAQLWDLLMRDSDAMGCRFLLDLDAETDLDVGGSSDTAGDDEQLLWTLDDTQTALSAAVRTKIDALQAHAHYATCAYPRHLDADILHCLHVKGASVHFLFEPAWALASTDAGLYQHAVTHGMRTLGTVLARRVEKVSTHSYRLAQAHAAVAARRASKTLELVVLHTKHNDDENKVE